MKHYSLYKQDSGSFNPPPPPPPPSFNPPPPPPPPGSNLGTSGTVNSSGSASSNAIIALVLGIAAWVLGCGLLTAIPAWILGKKEINAIDAGQAPQAGRTLAVIGMWLGIINVILSILAIIVIGLLFALGVIGSLSDFT